MNSMHSRRHSRLHDRKSPGPEISYERVSHTAKRRDMKYYHDVRQRRSPTQNSKGRSYSHFRVQDREDTDSRRSSNDERSYSTSHGDGSRPVSRNNRSTFHSNSGYSPVPLQRSSSTERKFEFHDQKPCKPIYESRACFSRERRTRSRSPLHLSRPRECRDDEKQHANRERSCGNTMFSDYSRPSGFETPDLKHDTFLTPHGNATKSSQNDEQHELIRKPVGSARRRRPSRWSDEKINLSKVIVLNVAKTDNVTKELMSGQQVWSKNVPEKGVEKKLAMNGGPEKAAEKSAGSICSTWIHSAPWMHKKQIVYRKESDGVLDDSCAKVVSTSATSGSFSASIKSSLPSVEESNVEARPETVKPRTSMAATCHSAMHTNGFKRIQLDSSLDKTGLVLDPCSCALTEAENLRTLRLSRFLQESLGSCGSVASLSSSHSNGGEVASCDSSPTLVHHSGVPTLPMMELPSSMNQSGSSNYQLSDKHENSVLADLYTLALPGGSFINGVHVPNPSHPVLPELTSHDKIQNVLQPSFPLNMCPTTGSSISNLPTPGNAALPGLRMSTPNIMPPIMFRDIRPNVPAPSTPPGGVGSQPNLELSLKQNHLLIPQILQGIQHRHILNGMHAAFQGLSSLPRLTSMHGLTGVARLPGVAEGPGGGGLPGFLGLSSMPPGMPEGQGMLPGMPETQGMPGMSQGMPGMSQGMPGMSQGMPGMSPGMPKVQGMPGVQGLPPGMPQGMPGVQGLPPGMPQGMPGVQGLPPGMPQGMPGVQGMPPSTRGEPNKSPGMSGLPGMSGMVSGSGVPPPSYSHNSPPPVSMVANTNCGQSTLVTMPPLRTLANGMSQKSISQSSEPKTESRNDPSVISEPEKSHSLPSMMNRTESASKELVKTVFVPVFYNPSVPPPLI